MSFVPVSSPHFCGNEKRYLQECIESGWVSSEGPFVSRFEAAFADKCDRKHGVAVSSGSAALEVAFSALKIQPGDEVIVPTFTIISCVAPLVRMGAKVVFVDSRPDTWCMDIAQVEAKVTPRTVAILAVHTYGLPVDMNPLIELTEKYGIALIEDAAESIGDHYRGRACGSFGVISTISFYANKHVSSGEGGMVLTNDAELAERCRSLRNLCFQREKRFYHEELGWNYRMSNLQAAMGLAQLEGLSETSRLKRALGTRYQQAFKALSGIQLPVDETEYANNGYWVFGLIFDPDTFPEADQVAKQLKQLDIGTRPFFYPMHLQPVFNEAGLFLHDRFPVSEHLSTQGLYIPSGASMSDEQIQQVCDAVTQVANAGVHSS